ncbi:MAG: GH25 family lysozyme, partial [Bacteroidaceae bacterium]
DVEHAGKVSEEQFVSDLRRFIEQVTKFYGRRPLIYTFHNFYNRHLSGKFPGYKWMIARYREDEPTLDDGQDFIVWQYTAKGSIPGIRGNVDKSKIMENYSLSEILF